MLLCEKEIIFSRHALQRCAEWQFPRGAIREALRSGFVCLDKEPDKKQCVYKFQKQYFTIVFCEYEKVAVIVTVYHSSPLEIQKVVKRQFE